MLLTITQAAKRLGWHRTTVWRKASSDSSFPTIVYIGPKSPRINTVFGDSGGGKSWISLWAMVEQMLRGNDVVPPKIRKKGLFVDF